MGAGAGAMAVASREVRTSLVVAAEGSHGLVFALAAKPRGSEVDVSEAWLGVPAESAGSVSPVYLRRDETLADRAG